MLYQLSYYPILFLLNRIAETRDFRVSASKKPVFRVSLFDDVGDTACSDGTAAFANSESL